MMSAKYALPISLLLAFGAVQSHAQARIWRCAGNTYTNDAGQAQAQGCKPMEGGNVTVVEGTKVHGGSSATRVASVQPAAATPRDRDRSERIDPAEQKARDSDARQLLEAELRKAEARQAELQKEWNNGEPEKMGPEFRNHQKYLDRVAQLKEQMTRNENDINGLRRELSRHGGQNGAAAAAK